jgi:hypothetical protein
MDDVLLSLQALERIGYRMSDWSWMKMKALMQRSLNVPRVSKRHATFNDRDVVR